MEFDEILTEEDLSQEMVVHLSHFQSRLQMALESDGLETPKQALDFFINDDGCFKYHFHEKPAVCLCAEINKIELLTLLLKSGLDLEQRDRQGWTPLHIAAAAGHKRMVEFLLDKGADVDHCVEDYHNRLTPLHVAVEFQHEDVVAFLLSKGARVDSGIPNQTTPLHLASGKTSLEIVKLLVEAGAMLDCRDKRGFTPLLHACDDRHWQIASFLVEKGADVNVQSPGGNTPLLFVASVDVVNIPLLSDLLTANASVHNRNDLNETPLHAIVCGNRYSRRSFLLEALELLLLYKCDINARGHLGYTPLHYAVCYEDERGVLALISVGCSVDIEDDFGSTPVSKAIQKNFHRLTELLLAAGASISLSEWVQLQEVLRMQDPFMLERIRAMRTGVPELTNFCRRAFLKRYGIEFWNRLDDLHLPTTVKWYLAFETL